MSSFLLAIFIPVLSLSAPVLNPPQPPSPPTTLDCTVRVVADDIKEGSGEAKFNTPIVSHETHGGEQRKFTFAPYDVMVLADGKWLGISWWRGEDLIAEGVFVIGNPSKESRVAVFYDPKDRSKMVSLDCNLPEVEAPALKPQRF